MSPAAEERQRHLESFLREKEGLAWLNRAVVLDECGSTQDEAFDTAAGKHGLLMTALRQTRGRGRLGRSWDQKSELGLAATFVLDAAAHDAASLPIRVGCAVCLACEGASGLEPVDTSDAVPNFRIKWPNDVVVSREVHDRHAPHKKLAGILIEQKDNLLLVGIGINVLQREADWPKELQGRAVSLAQLGGGLGGGPPRHDWILRRLIDSLDGFLFADRREVRQEFRLRDVLTGTRQRLEHNQKRYEGLVDSIDPIEGITIRLDNGRTVTLPALTTTIIS
jgi:BirA family biotin operon repressor/biotin-[acetyl-CoA-carboxylase] ligase